MTQLYGGPVQSQTKPEMFYNDAAVDRQGRLLVGTFNMQILFRRTARCIV